MSDKLIIIEEQEGPFQTLLLRILRMVPDRDKKDKNLQRLLAFRLRIDGEAALSEYLIRKIRETIKCAYTGRLYNFLKDANRSRRNRTRNLQAPPNLITPKITNSPQNPCPPLAALQALAGGRVRFTLTTCLPR